MIAGRFENGVEVMLVECRWGLLTDGAGEEGKTKPGCSKISGTSGGAVNDASDVTSLSTLIGTLAALDD
jgi:hypothetical protein